MTLTLTSTLTSPEKINWDALERETRIKVSLKASHFKGLLPFTYLARYKYFKCTGCPFARALKEKFKTNSVEEHRTWANINGVYCKHAAYDLEDFLRDRKVAKENKFSPELVIRQIQLWFNL